MEIRFKNIYDIMGDELSLVERGLLITIMLLKDPDPKLTEAKVRAKIKVSDVRTELIHLCDLNLIKWKGYAAAKKALFANLKTPDAKAVIEFMNNLYGTKFNPDSPNTIKNLINRLNENSIEDVKLVVANRYAEWKDDKMMYKHLTPHTIFRPSKFDKYLAEALKTKSGESLVNASKIDLKEGDEITYEISKKLTQDDLYKVRSFEVINGKRFGSGRPEKRSGKELERVLRIQNNQVEKGFDQTIIYLYLGK